MAGGQQSHRVALSSSAASMLLRQRASPARIVKLYNELIEDQKDMIDSIGFGGLLKIACKTLHADFANWLMVECYDSDSSELVLPGRGRIKVNADVVCSAFGLPNSGDAVKNELNVDAINLILEKFDIDEGTTPSIDSIMERLKKNKMCNDDFLRSWLMIAISTFLCPPTGLSISLRCYLSIMGHSKVKELNWCQFVVDQLKGTSSRMGKRKSLRVCLLVLVIIYVDSLVVDSLQIPSTAPRVAAWTRKLLDQVIKLDTNRDGSFGKLKLKGSRYSTPQASLFNMDNVRRFASSKVPRGTSD